jgi:hypothetical protein
MTRVAAALVALSAAAATASPSTAAAGSWSVSTLGVHDVTSTSATFRAWVTPPKSGASVGFQFGKTVSYTSGTSATGVPGGSGGRQVTFPVTGLSPATTYHVRAVATSGASWATGGDVSFTTAAVGAPAPPDPPQDDPGTTDQTGDEPADDGSAADTPSPAPADPAPLGPVTPAGPTTTVLPPAPAATAPALGRTVAAGTTKGVVTAVDPTGAPLDLSAATSLPSGTVIDARRGTVQLTTAVDRKGTTQTGTFWGARFQVRQSASGGGMTQLILKGGDFSHCAATANARTADGARAVAAAAKKPPRTLWGSDHNGRFQTRGRGSVATVRGTRWVTEDRCNGTLTRVLEGAVAVHDLGRNTTTVVAHGHHYLARVAR